MLNCLCTGANIYHRTDTSTKFDREQILGVSKREKTRGKERMSEWEYICTWKSTNDRIKSFFHFIIRHDHSLSKGCHFVYSSTTLSAYSTCHFKRIRFRVQSISSVCREVHARRDRGYNWAFTKGRAQRYTARRIHKYLFFHFHNFKGILVTKLIISFLFRVVVHELLRTINSILSYASKMILVYEE